jgi:hypothetical protein
VLVVLKNKNEGVTSRKQMFLLISSQHVSAQTGHHQMILEENTNGNEMHINCSSGSGLS